MKKQYIYIAASFLILFLSASCDKEYTNPSIGVEEVILRDVDGMIALANGLQYRYTIGRQSPAYTIIVASGLSGQELRVLNAGNADEDFLGKGAANVLGNNAVVSNLWSQLQLVRTNADQILNNVNNIGDPATRSGLIGYASIFKALSLGTLAQFWERSPITTSSDAQFLPRTDVLQEAIRILEAANTVVTATAPSAAFANRIVLGIIPSPNHTLPTTINALPNTINALIARYSLMVGDYDKAIAAADRVNLSIKSEFRFDDLTRNPIFDVALSTINVVQPASLNMGLPENLKPAAEDKRIDFYFRSRTPNENGIFNGRGFFTSNSSPIPVYLPGEMLLIKAEAYARKNDLTKAVEELDKVLKKKPSEDVWGIGADLPAYSGPVTQAAILTEIYRNRSIELFMSGLKLEDSRRFGRPGPVAGQPTQPANIERNRNFYPYPFIEVDNNPLTPTYSGI